MERTVHTDPELRSILGDIALHRTSLDFVSWEIDSIPIEQGWMLQCVFTRPDINTGEVGLGRSRLEFIARGATESAVVKTVWLLIKTTIEHELMESFHWRGYRIFNPHNSVSQLASIQRPQAEKETVVL